MIKIIINGNTTIIEAAILIGTDTMPALDDDSKII
jgi:hypothetical protein